MSDVDGIIATAKSGLIPANWTVWKLRREHVLRGVFYWFAVGVIGVICLIPATIAGVTDTLLRGGFSTFLAATVIVALGIMTFGGFYLGFLDLSRGMNAGDYLLIMTPEYYIQVRPKRVTAVPMANVSQIRLTGQRPRTTATAYDQMGTQIETSRMQMMLGVSRLVGVLRFAEPKGAPSLSFIDNRTGARVQVSEDKSFDELHALEYVLRLHARGDEMEYAS